MNEKTHMRGIKRKIRIMFLIVVMIMVFTPHPPSILAAEIIASGTCGDKGDNVTWQLDEGGTLTISGTGDMRNWNGSTWRAPWVTCGSSIKSIVIEEGISNIGDYAFIDCESLTNVTLSNNLTKIGQSAFSGCKALQNIEIPDSVTSIGNWAFAQCESLTNASLSNNLTEIGEGVFNSCKAIKSIEIPDSVTRICRDAFSYCASLASITIPKSVTYIASRNYDSFMCVPTSLVFIVSKPSYAYDWVLQAGRHFKIIDSPITVTFDSNGGSSVPPIYDFTGNSTISEPAKPQREGYIFNGWRTYKDGAFYPIDGLKIVGSVTLYADWLRNSFTVTFNSNGGSPVPAVTNIARNSEISKPNAPTRKGYIFDGWFEGSSDWEYDFKTEISDDKTLTAKWTKNKAKLPKIKTITEGYTNSLKISSNTPISKVKWTSSNKKIIKITKAKKTSVTIKGIRKKKKATLKAVVTFKDGSTQTIKQTISVKGKIKYPSYASYPKGIQTFNRKVGAYNSGRDWNGTYKYYVLSRLTSRLSLYHYYLIGKGYRLKKDYYPNPPLEQRVFIYTKGTVKVKIDVLPTNIGEGFVAITWNTKKKKK